MIKPDLPTNENARLDALKEYHVLDTIHEDEFDEIARLAGQICNSPISLISLIDQNRQWFKSNIGLSDATETSREYAFCAHAILEPEEIMIVKDATKDQRFVNNPFVNDDPKIRFYAGAPLVNSEGFALGTLCVIDRSSKDLDKNQVNALRVLSNQVVKQLELRKSNIELKELSGQLEIHINELQQKHIVLEGINKFVTQLVQLSEVYQIVECIIYHLKNQFKFESCTVLLVDDAQEYLYESSEIPSSDIQGVEQIIKNPIGTGVSGLVAKTGEPILNNDYESGSILAVPFLSDNVVIGIIEVRQNENGYFTNEHLELLTTVANLSSSKLRNSVDRSRIDNSQKSLSESEAKNRRILDMALDAVISINSEGIITGWNPQASQLFGFSLEEADGRKLSELIIPENYREAHEKGLRHFVKTGEGAVLGKRIEISAINKSGDEFPVELTVVPIKIGDEYSATAFIRDISLKIKAEQEMKDALEKQKQLTELKSKFVSMTSHEFRTPLTTIQANIELLMFQMQDISFEKQEKIDKNFNRILDEIKRLTDLMNDILMLGRLESGKIPFHPLPVSIVDLCKEIIEERYSHRKDSHTVDLDIKGEHHHYKLDSNIYTHILTNLLSNAFKYSKGSGSPRIELICEKEYFELKVIDKGIGIPEPDKDKIFETFHRARNADEIQGTGLGLSIVKQFVSLHDGKITFDSKVNVGTTFSIYQPLLN